MALHWFLPRFDSGTRERPLRTRRTRALLVAAVIVPALASCRAAILAYGSDAASARAHADALASAIEQRFTHVVRTPKFANARMRIGRYALAPSKLVNDSALWTSARTTRTGPERDLELGAGMSGAQYAFVARPRVAPPSRTGDERHLIRLTALGDDDWQWSTEVDHAVGTVPPARLDDIARALFASAERPGAAVRADYRATLPRTSQALGQMFAIDTIDSRAQPDGSYLVSMGIRVHADGLVKSFPAFAKYVDKYVAPTRYRFRLTDRTGAEWFDANAMQQERLVIRFRSRGGELQPLSGAARRMPDSLILNVDALAKFGLFTVGVTRMQGDFVHVESAGERGWAMRFTKDPEWHLPLIAERLLRSPLRRPFEGRGLVFRMAFKAGPESQTLFARTFDVTVRESAIMRFLGNLGFTAMSDYAGKVEEQENRFIAEAFAAMRADIRSGS